MAERTPRSLTLVRHIRWKLHLTGHHDAAHSAFLAGTWRTSNAEDRADALACLARDARDHALSRVSGPAFALATRLRRVARDHDEAGGPFTVEPDEAAVGRSRGGPTTKIHLAADARTSRRRTGSHRRHGMPERAFCLPVVRCESLTGVVCGGAQLAF
ncbi:hypothetical protein [Streptomyces albus]|uniref:hypothetical protein n=1 Tax=Streptomyces albus TaxID=1888 RepID=UPI003D15861E